MRPTTEGSLAMPSRVASVWTLALLLLWAGCQSGPRTIPGPRDTGTALPNAQDATADTTTADSQLDTETPPLPEDAVSDTAADGGTTVFDDTEPPDDTPVVGVQHPCQTSTLPGSNDPDITQCVCELDPFCCEGPWDSLCVAYAASPACGVECDCTNWDATDLACGTDDDCLICDDDNPCNGVWQCVGGQCTASAPTVCEPLEESVCVINACNPLTGACELSSDSTACDDGNFCSVDACDLDTDTCTFSPIENCGDNHPCAPASTPTSMDPVVTDCVCAIDSFCCETAWDSTCVEKAQTQCDQTCTCETAEPTALLCTADSDCAFCDDNSDLCDGTWRCLEGLCSSVPTVVCDNSNDLGCVISVCLPALGACTLQAQAGMCADGEVCTSDSCAQDTGTCSNLPIPNCNAAEYSCNGACPDPTYDLSKPCQCDPTCWEFGDCCEDLCTYCSDPDHCSS